jgi:hypothetical protein
MKHIFVLLFTMIVIQYQSCYSQGNKTPDIFDNRFQLLVSDIENQTDYYFLVQDRNENFISVWLRIKLPNIETKDSKNKLVKKTGGFELVLYTIDCNEQIIEEKKRVRTNILGMIQNVIPKYPENNSFKIIPRTFMDLLRINTCE